jgi:hypothetical protein
MQRLLLRREVNLLRHCLSHRRRLLAVKINSTHLLPSDLLQGVLPAGSYASALPAVCSWVGLLHPTAPPLLLTLVHRSAWKARSRKFATVNNPLATPKTAQMGIALRLLDSNPAPPHCTTRPLLQTSGALCSAFFLLFFPTQIALDLDVLDAEVAKGDAAEAAGFSPYVAKLVEIVRNLKVTTLVLRFPGV